METDTGVLIFSRDRAFQLEACLRSFFETAEPEASFLVTVLFRATTELHCRQYNLLKRQFRRVSFVEERGFHDQTIESIGLCPYVLFVVDDSIFIKSWSIAQMKQSLEAHSDAIGFSMRLGKNITYCYPLKKTQQVPEFEVIEETGAVLMYDWRGCDGDFGYPLEVSSSVYRSPEILEILQDSEFSRPNELERDLFRKLQSCENNLPKLLTFETSVAFACPINIVQDQKTNRSGDDFGVEADELATRFDDGLRMDLAFTRDFVPISCHQEVPVIYYDLNQKSRRREASSDSFPLVSVVIVCYNYGAYLMEAIESVRAQTLKSVEIIVVDGGSDDSNTIEVLKNISGTGVRLFCREGRHLIGDNRNFGISHAKGKFICCLDADDKLRPNCLEKALITLISEAVDIVSPARMEFGANTKFSLLKESPTTEDILAENQFNTVALFKKLLWQRVGGYQDFGLGRDHFYEDWHYWMKCLSLGAKAKNLFRETLFQYRVHSEGSLSRQKGEVPRIDEQQQFIQREHNKLKHEEFCSDEIPQQLSCCLEDIEVGNLVGTQCVIIVLPEFSHQTIVSQLLPFIDKTIKHSDDVVLLSTKSYADKEDRTGQLLDEITPFHYDLKRSFPSFSVQDFLKYLFASRKVKQMYAFQGALDQGDICFAGDALGVDRVNSVCRSESVDSKQTENGMVDVIIRNVDRASEISNGHEVWLLGIRNEDGFLSHVERFRDGVDSDWQLLPSNASPNENAIVSTGAAEIVFQLPLGSSLSFLSHDWSGIVEIEANGQINELDLYAPQSRVVEVSALKL